jgi:hypothetical protein
MAPRSGDVPWHELRHSHHAAQMTAGVSIALALLFLAAAAGKLTGMTQEMGSHLGVAVPVWRAIGVLELAGAVGVLVGIAVEDVGLAAGIGLLLTSLGAIATHTKAGDPAKAIAPAAVALVLSCAVVALQAT